MKRALHFTTKQNSWDIKNPLRVHPYTVRGQKIITCSRGRWEVGGGGGFFLNQSLDSPHFDQEFLDPPLEKVVDT